MKYAPLIEASRWTNPTFARSAESLARKEATAAASSGVANVTLIMFRSASLGFVESFTSVRVGTYPKLRTTTRWGPPGIPERV